MELSKEAIQEFRELRLYNLSIMLKKVSQTTEDAGAPSTDQLLVRRYLVDLQSSIKEKIQTNAPLDEEEISLLQELESDEEEIDE